MSADTKNEDTTTLNVRIPESLLNDIDRVVEERGFVSRSEFVRHQLRAGIDPAVRLSEETLAALAESEDDPEQADTISHEQLKAELDAN